MKADGDLFARLNAAITDAQLDAAAKSADLPFTMKFAGIGDRRLMIHKRGPMHSRASLLGGVSALAVETGQGRLRILT